MRYARMRSSAPLLVAPALRRAGRPADQRRAEPVYTVKDYFKLPEGRAWGSTSAVDIDKDGKSIWVAERCGQNSCLDRATGKISDVPTVLKFDASGKLVKSFGAGLLIFPHGIHVDRDGNVWVTDGQDNAPLPQRGAGAASAAAPKAAAARRRPARSVRGPARPRATRCSSSAPTAKCCSRSASRAAPRRPSTSTSRTTSSPRPTATSSSPKATAPATTAILKFDKTGKFIKEWGKLGTGPGEFDQPHALAFDSQGRLFVGDRNNNRVQVFDQDGKFITEYRQFSRPSGIFIQGRHALRRRLRIRIGVAQPRRLEARHPLAAASRTARSRASSPILKPRPRAEGFTGTSAAEGVAVDNGRQHLRRRGRAQRAVEAEYVKK